jgi:hypothetical protein
MKSAARDGRIWTLRNCTIRRRAIMAGHSDPGRIAKTNTKKNGETRVPILVIAEGFALRCCDTSARWRASAVCAGAVFDGLRGNPERVTEIAR